MPKSRPPKQDWLTLPETETLVARADTPKSAAYRNAALTTAFATLTYIVIASLTGRFSVPMLIAFAISFFCCFALIALGLRHQGDWALSDQTLYLRKGLRFDRKDITTVSQNAKGVKIAANTAPNTPARHNQHFLQSPTPETLAQDLSAAPTKKAS